MVGKRPGSRGQMLLPYTTLFRSQGRRQESVVRKILLEVLQDLDRLSRPSGHPQREGELELEGRQDVRCRVSRQRPAVEVDRLVELARALGHGARLEQKVRGARVIRKARRGLLEETDRRKHLVLQQVPARLALE